MSISNKKRIFSPYIGYSFVPADAKKPRFKSRITRENGRLMDRFKTMDGRTSGIASYPEPLTEVQKFYGFWMSSNVGDMHNVLSCGLILLSRTAIEVDRIAEEIAEGYEFYGDIPSMIRLRASNPDLSRKRKINSKRRMG